MKKRMSIIVIAIVVIATISLCACGEAKQNLNSEDEANRELEAKHNLNSEEKLLMLINMDETTLYLSNAGRAVIASLKGEDEKTIMSHFEDALELVKTVKERIDDSISSPNFISKGLEKLEESYEKSIVLLSRFPELSEEEKDEFKNLIEEGISNHMFLLKAFYASSNLYQIRNFDQLPDDEAQSTLKDNWYTFGFNDSIKCPESIDEQELYLIWAKQHFEGFDEDEFLERLSSLREDDDLCPECNKKWTDFIENFISKVEEGSILWTPSSVFNYYPNEYDNSLSQKIPL